MFILPASVRENALFSLFFNFPNFKNMTVSFKHTWYKTFAKV